MISTQMPGCTTSFDVFREKRELNEHFEVPPFVGQSTGLCQVQVCCLCLLVCLIQTKERLEMKIAITAIAAIAGAATASPYFTEAAGFTQTDAAPAGAFATVTIDISGTNSWDLELDPDNESLSALFAGGTHITGIGWNATIATNGGSWLSESVMRFNNDLYLTVGIGDDFAGTGSYSSGGVFDLVGTGLDFFLAGDGLLNIEFFESFDDVADAIDNTFVQGSLQIQYEVPAPSALAMLGLGGLVAGRRRR